MKPLTTEFEREGSGLQPEFREGVVQREKERDPKNTPIAVVEINLFANLENGAMVTHSYSNFEGLKLLSSNPGARVVNMAMIGNAMVDSLESFLSHILELEARPLAEQVMREMGIPDTPHDC